MNSKERKKGEKTENMKNTREKKKVA